MASRRYLTAAEAGGIIRIAQEREPDDFQSHVSLRDDSDGLGAYLEKWDTRTLGAEPSTTEVNAAIDRNTGAPLPDATPTEKRIRDIEARLDAGGL